MDKYSIDDKIKKLIKCLLIFLTIYMVVGGWLVSDGLYFDKSKTYNLLKDGLTFTLALLAPSAAIVLYHDWRTEHRAKKNEGLSFEIKSKFTKLLPYLALYPSNLPMSLSEFQSEFNQHLQSLRNSVDEVVAHDKKSSNFKNELDTQLENFDQYLKNFNNVAQYNIKYSNFIDMNVENDSELCIILQLLDEANQAKGDVVSKIISYFNQFKTLKI